MDRIVITVSDPDRARVLIAEWLSVGAEIRQHQNRPFEALELLTLGQIVLGVPDEAEAAA